MNGSVFLPCPRMFEFPKKCPLPEGKPVPKTTEELIQLTKDELVLRQSKRTARIPHPKLRRNRKNCIRLMSDGITCATLDPTDKKCKGVNCGYYTPEK